MSRGQKKKRRIDGEGSLWQDSQGTWFAQRTHWQIKDGKKRRRYITGTGPTQKLALARLQANISTALEERKIRRATGPKISDVRDAWLEDCKKQGRTQAITRERNRANIDRYLIEHLNDVSISKITPEDMVKLFDATFASLDLTVAQKRNAYQSINPMFNWAVRQGMIDQNPLRRVPRPSVPMSSKRRDEEDLIDAYMSILRGLLSKLKNPPENFKHFAPLYLPLRLEMTFGLRTGELLGLTRNCFKGLNGKNKTALMEIKKQLAYGEGDDRHLGIYLKDSTKNQKTRALALPQVIADEVKAYMKRYPPLAEPWSDLLFYDPQTNQPYHPKKWSTHLNAMLSEYMGDRAYHGGKKWTIRPHFIRHISATLMAEGGVNVATAQAILGHSSEAMTRYYTKATRASLLEASESTVDLLDRKRR